MIECTLAERIGVMLEVLSQVRVENVTIINCDIGLVLNGTQNSTFKNVLVQRSGVGILLDHGAAGNLFLKTHTDECGTGLLLAHGVVAAAPETDNYAYVNPYGPSLNNFEACGFERTNGVPGEAQVAILAGLSNKISNSFIEASAGQLPLLIENRYEGMFSSLHTLEGIDIQSTKPVTLRKAWNVRLNGGQIHVPDGYHFDLSYGRILADSLTHYTEPLKIKNRNAEAWWGMFAPMLQKQ